ncbi:MAG: DNA cytosine methyltransferase [Bacteroidales bacterium]|nr:DNA cytosine methyltransferase [Bacteroidales bacterium]
MNSMHTLPRHRTIRVFEGFAGYGGAAFALRRSGIRHRVVGFSENAPDAIELYQYSFPITKNFGDIKQINPNTRNFPNFE